MSESSSRLRHECHSVRDKDDIVLECAVHGTADYIVTGDRKHLLRLGNYGGMQIVDPATRLSIVEAKKAT